MKRSLGTAVVLALAGGGMAYEIAAQSFAIVPFAHAEGLPQTLTTQLGQDPDTPVEGTPLGSVTLVEFFDYRCPYCRMMKPTLDKLIAKDRRVRLVLKEWPIFGGVSIDAARMALASQWQGKYAAVHAAFFALPRTMDLAALRHAAAGAGVDMARLDNDMRTRSGQIDAALAQVRREAHAIGFQGTPGFVVGRIVVPGALTAADMDKLVNEAAAK